MLPRALDLSPRILDTLTQALDTLRQLVADILNPTLQAVLGLTPFAEAIDQGVCAVRDCAHGDHAGDAQQGWIFAGSLGHVFASADRGKARLGSGHSTQTASHAAFDFFYCGGHVAAQASYLSLSVRRCRTHSRSSLSVSRVRGSGGQIDMAWLMPGRMKRL